MAQRPKPHLLNTQTKTQNLTFACLAFSSQTGFQSSSVPLFVCPGLPKERVSPLFSSVHHDFEHTAELSLCLRFLSVITATSAPYSYCATEVKDATPWAAASLLPVITVLREPLDRDQTLLYPSNAKFWRGNSVNHFNFPWSHPVWVSSPATEFTEHPIRDLKLGCSCASISLICQTLSSLRVKNTSALFTTESSGTTEWSAPSTYRKYTK